MRSWVCVRQFRDEKHHEDLLAGTPDAFFIKVLLATAASNKQITESRSSISVLHACTQQGRNHLETTRRHQHVRVLETEKHPSTELASQNNNTFHQQDLDMIFPIIDLNPCGIENTE